MTIRIDCTCIRKIARLAALFILPMTALTASAQTAPPPPPTPSADLAVFNTATNPNQGRYDFVITVVNNGPTAAEQVVLTDALPAAGVTFQKVVFNSSKRVSCPVHPPVGQTGLVSCTTASLEPGAGFSVSIVVDVKGPSGTEITDMATVQSLTTQRPESGQQQRQRHNHYSLKTISADLTWRPTRVSKFSKNAHTHFEASANACHCLERADS